MKRNLILLIIAAAIVGYYYWDTEREEQKKEQETKENQITILKPEEVTALVIEAKGETIRAEKDGEQWKIVEPVQALADKPALESVINTFAGGKRQRVIETNPSDLEKFGLADPSAAVTLIGGTTQESKISFGKATPTAGKYYALVHSSSEVITLFSSAFTALDKRLFDFRDKTIVSLDPSQVQKVEIAHPQMNVVVERKGDRWQITQPVTARADGTKIEELITQFNNGKVKQFVEENVGVLEAYGLVNPATKTVFWTGAPGDASSLAAKAVLFGSTNESQYVYGKRDGQNNVFAVSPMDFNKIPISMDDIRLKKLTPQRSWEINKMKLTAPALVLEVSKAQSEWDMLQPQQGRADYNTVSDLVRAVVDLEAAKFVDTATDQMQLGSPILTVEIESEKGMDIFSLVQGPAGEDGSIFYYAVKQDPTEIIAINSSAIDKIIQDASAVKLETPPEPTPAPEVETATDTVESATP